MLPLVSNEKLPAAIERFSPSHKIYLLPAVFFTDIFEVDASVPKNIPFPAAAYPFVAPCPIEI